MFHPSWASSGTQHQYCVLVEAHDRCIIALKWFTAVFHCPKEVSFNYQVSLLKHFYSHLVRSCKTCPDIVITASLPIISNSSSIITNPVCCFSRKELEKDVESKTSLLEKIVAEIETLVEATGEYVESAVKTFGLLVS